jgi:hypothetical protein
MIFFEASLICTNHFGDLFSFICIYLVLLDTPSSPSLRSLSISVTSTPDSLALGISPYGVYSSTSNRSHDDNTKGNESSTRRAHVHACTHQGCIKAFPKQSALVRHMRTHTVIMPRVAPDEDHGRR